MCRQTSSDVIMRKRQLSPQFLRLVLSFLLPLLLLLLFSPPTSSVTPALFLRLSSSSVLRRRSRLPLGRSPLALDMTPPSKELRPKFHTLRADAELRHSRGCKNKRRPLGGATALANMLGRRSSSSQSFVIVIIIDVANID